MPLMQGNTDYAKSTNIKRLMGEGREQDQAVAIAMDVARRNKRAAGGPTQYTRDQLERMDADHLDRMAFGHADGDTVTAHPDKFQIKYPGDLENPQHKWDTQGGMRWAKSVNFKEPVDLSIGHDGRLNLEDGHHRWFAAKKLGRKLKGRIVKSDGRPIEHILEQQARAQKAGGGGVDLPKLNVQPARPRLHVGPIHSSVAGRTDHLPMHVPNKAYVLPADIVSGMGQGNTIAGFKIARNLPDIFHRMLYGKVPKSSDPYGQGAGPYGYALPSKARGGTSSRDVGQDIEESHGVPYGHDMPGKAAGGSVDSAQKALGDAAVEHFGLTNNPDEAGYILPDGRHLDLTGRHYATGYENKRPKPGQPDYLRGVRSVDHRELPDNLDGGKGGTKGMFHFMKHSGAVRHMAGAGVSVVTMPTEAQLRAIVRAHRAGLNVDVDHPETMDNIASQEFARPTIDALRAFFQKHVHKAEGGAADRSPENATGVPIIAAGGEHVYSPDEIAKIGNGDIDLGHDILDAFVKMYRAEHIKTLQKLPGPKRD